MATLKIEIGKERNKQHFVTFLVCSGKTKKRISTNIKLSNKELSSNGKIIKNPVKAHLIEEQKYKLQTKIDKLLAQNTGQKLDAKYIVEHITSSSNYPGFFHLCLQMAE